MKCGKCGATAKLLYTKDYEEDFMVLRRRECANGHRFTTYETVAAAMPHSSEARRLAYARNAATRCRNLQRDQEIWMAHRKGESYGKIGQRLVLARATVQRICERVEKQRADAPWKIKS